MWSAIISFILPILEPLGVWAIKTFVGNLERKNALLRDYYAWIEAHKNDGVNSASQGQKYQDQLNELKHEAEARDNAGGQNESDSKPEGKQG